MGKRANERKSGTARARIRQMIAAGYTLAAAHKEMSLFSYVHFRRLWLQENGPLQANGAKP